MTVSKAMKRLWKILKDGSHYDTLFNQMISQSKRYKQQLIQEVRTTGGDAD